MNIPRFNQQPIDTSVYNQMMKNITPRMDKVGKIRKIVTSVTGADPYTDPSYRGAKYVKSRQLFMYFVYKYAGFTQDAAASLLNKDHATVYHAIKCVGKYSDTEKDYLQKYKLIENEIKLIK